MNPDRDPQLDPQTKQTPETVSKLIRFALSELSAENAHHEFEHLCRHVARRRICSNIIPATGPVSGGGDKGADFETIPAIQSGFGQSRYWQLACPGKILFACSLEKNLKKKIKADVKAAAEFGEPLERMYFFYNRPIKVGDRNKFKEDALKEHGIRLEIVDALAIAEFLADSELLWIAEKYLSLPSEVTVPPVGPAPTWYSTLVAMTDSELPRNADTFYQLKSALRYATANPDHHSEIPRIIQHVRLFASHPDRIIARKAFYEEFVAVLRGLNAAENYESKVLEYLSAISDLSEPSELEDAGIILSYANGACARGILKIDTDIRIKFRDDLLAKLDSLLTPEPTFLNCALLFVKGHLFITSAALEDPPADSTEHPIVKAAETAVTVWTTLIKHSRQVPFYPVERLESQVVFLFPLIASDKFSAFVKKLDALTAERAGVQAVAEQFVIRAAALLDSKQYIRALQEFHGALRLSHSSESQENSIVICLQLAALYYHIGLYHAAKYYGLAAAYASLQLPEDDLRKYSSVGLSLAAQVDYATGASMLFFLTCKAFVWIANQYSMAGRKQFREQEWSKVDYYGLLITRAAKIISEDLYRHCRDMLKRLDADDIYHAYEESLEAQFKDLDVDLLKERFVEEGISVPFCDYGQIRKTLWRQFGVTWRVEWKSGYESERYGEAACAAMQIVFGALAETEFSLIATEVAIEIITDHSGAIRIKQVPDNKVLRFTVAIDPTKGMDLTDQLNLAYIILSVSSAIPTEDFKSRFVEEFKQGLAARIGVYISPTEVFRQFYVKENYEELHAEDPTEWSTKPCVTRTWDGLAEVATVHPDFNEAEALEQITNRYRRGVELFKYTLSQLSSDSAFLQLVQGLRNSGWKDWHVLLAVGSVRTSSFLNMGSKDYERLAEDIALNGEREEYPLTPASVYNAQSLKTGLEMSQLSTLKNLGFRLEQMTPNFKGINSFLARFKYWALDVPHQNPFVSS